MRITYQVEDGYCGGSRPQHLEIDDEDFEYCETEEEAEKLLHDSIQEDFEQKVSWTIMSAGDLREKIKKLVGRKE